MASNAIRRPKTQRGKRALLARESKIVENEKQLFCIRGGNCHLATSSALKNIYLLKRPNSILLKRKNIIRPFEDETPLERFSHKLDASLFCFASDSKKRPNTLVFGRMFDARLLDMIELHVTQFKDLVEIKNEKIATGTKPMLIFVGELFDTEVEYQRLKNLFIDMFRGANVDQVSLKGLQHVIQFVATREHIYLRSFRVLMKESGVADKPLVQLEEIGPSFDFKMGRSKLASDDLLRNASKVPQETKAKKKKNISYDNLGSKFGRIHMKKQDLETLQTRKMKGLKRPRSSAASASDPANTASTAQDNETMLKQLRPS